MGRIIFPIIAGLALIIVKVGPEDFFRHVFPALRETPTVRPRAPEPVAPPPRVQTAEEIALEDLARAVGEIPVNEPDAVLVARIETSPAFQQYPTPQGVIEGPRYAADRIVSEASRLGLENIRTYTEYVEATHSILTTTPRNDQEFRSIFSRTPSASEADALASEADTVAREFQHVEDEESLLRSIEEEETNFVTIVGHNEGGYLQLPSGENLRIEIIAEHCSSIGKRCIFLSCNSADFLGAFEDSAFGVDRQITFRGAHMIASFLSERMAQRGVSSYLQTSDDLGEELLVLARAANLSEAISASTPRRCGGRYRWRLPCGQRRQTRLGFASSWVTSSSMVEQRSK
ncbi:hypothetical protein ACERZ8_03805 [Tateyamaria armeniaca]|uniref:CHAT domain-containing protein n=1 Tax=Tateyamaria armeniaca TaxID=2518930 RepID=A0ABW8UQ14_9RHOB